MWETLCACIDVCRQILDLYDGSGRGSSSCSASRSRSRSRSPCNRSSSRQRRDTSYASPLISREILLNEELESLQHTLEGRLTHTLLGHSPSACQSSDRSSYKLSSAQPAHHLPSSPCRSQHHGRSRSSARYRDSAPSVSLVSSGESSTYRKSERLQHIHQCQSPRPYPTKTKYYRVRKKKVSKEHTPFSKHRWLTYVLPTSSVSTASVDSAHRSRRKANVLVCPSCGYICGRINTMRCHCLGQHGAEWQGNELPLKKISTKHTPFLKQTLLNTVKSSVSVDTADDANRFQSDGTMFSCPDCDSKHARLRTLQWHCFRQHNAEWQRQGLPLKKILKEHTPFLKHSLHSTTTSSVSIASVVNANRPRRKRKSETSYCPYCDFRSHSIHSVRQHCLGQHDVEWQGNEVTLEKISTEQTQFFKHELHTTTTSSVPIASVDNANRSERKRKVFACPYCCFRSCSICTVRKHCLSQHDAEWHGNVLPLEKISTEQTPFLKYRLHSTMTSSQCITPTDNANRSQSNGKVFSCPSCDYKGVSVRIFLRHCIRQHSSEWQGKALACPVCDFKCGWFQTMRRHCLRQHSAKWQGNGHSSVEGTSLLSSATMSSSVHTGITLLPSSSISADCQETGPTADRSLGPSQPFSTVSESTDFHAASADHFHNASTSSVSVAFGDSANRFQREENVLACPACDFKGVSKRAVKRHSRQHRAEWQRNGLSLRFKKILKQHTPYLKEKSSHDSILLRQTDMQNSESDQYGSRIVTQPVLPSVTTSETSSVYDSVTPTDVYSSSSLSSLLVNTSVGSVKALSIADQPSQLPLPTLNKSADVSISVASSAQDTS